MGGEGGILEEDEEVAATATTGGDRTRYTSSRDQNIIIVFCYLI